MDGVARDELFALLEQAVADHTFPGCVALVWRAGAVLYHEAHGTVASHPAVAVRHHPVGRDTVFDLASLTKVLATTTLAAIAVSEGWLELDARLPDPWRRQYPEATLTHLLEHSAGYPAWRDFSGGSDFDARRVLDAVALVPATHPAGTRAVYSDLGFIVLGAWLERASGISLAELFRERVVYPLGLESEPLDHLAYRPLTAGSYLPQGLEPRVAPTEVYDPRLHGAQVPDYVERRQTRQPCAHGEVHDDNAFAMGGVAGHAGLFGTAWGVLEVARAWLQDLVPGLDPDVRRRFWQPSKVPDSVRCLGFDGVEPNGSGSTGEWFGPGSVGHLGFTGTSVWIDPRADAPCIAVLLTNRVHPVRDNPRIHALRPRFHRLAVRL